MSFGFMVAGFVATTNAGRVALAREATYPSPRDRVLALTLGGVLVVLAAAFADDALDALDISPESFRIAAGIVLAAAGARDLVWPRASSGAPFAVVLLTPELVCVALSFGADEPAGRVLAAAALALPLVAIAALTNRPRPGALPVQFLAALQIVVAVALTVSGVRDV
jgi:small neutral amino acid transporter SnatA (MarC family)